LEHHADRASQLGNLRGRQRHDVPAVDEDLALRGELAAKQETEERRLPRPGRPGDENELAAGDFEADVLERGGALGVRLGQAVDLDQGRATSSD
jgi:hypothetical protein